MSKNLEFSDWQEIADHELTLSSRCVNDTTLSATLTLKTSHVLAMSNSIHLPSAVIFDFRIEIPSVCFDSPMIVRGLVGCYGSLWSHRDELYAMRQGQVPSVRFPEAEQLDFRITEHQQSGWCVHGEVIDNLRCVYRPQLTSSAEIMAALDQSESVAANACSFAFMVESIDPYI